MNILFISSLPKTQAGGPRYSVPRQIYAQSDFDSVYWINFSPFGYNGTKVKCINIINPYRFKLESLPDPFNQPDIVVFEDLYYFEFVIFSLNLIRQNIPYIIIPRGSLSKYAQKRKFLKKKLANLFFFNYFIRKAHAIQFLTENELNMAPEKWKKSHLIIPNGVMGRSNTRTCLKREQKIGTYIGRIDVFIKGLDILINAIAYLRNEFIASSIKIQLYGPDRCGGKKILNDKIRLHKMEEIISIHEEIYGIEKEKVLLESDFFILTSRTEGHPTGLLEALTFGLPCMISQATGMANEIKKYNAGWVCESNIESLSKTFLKILSNENDFEEKGMNAYELSKNYDLKLIAEKTHKDYMYLINSIL